MTDILNFTSNIFRNIILILTKETSQNQLKLLLTYLKLNLKFLFLTKILNIKIYNDTIFGLKINVLNYPAFIYMFEEIFIRGDYYFIAKTDAPLIIDCGSNIGVSLLFFKKLYPKSKIIAFEPDKKAYGVLEKNVKVNNFINVELFNKAVSNKNGTINFYHNPQEPGSLIMSIKMERAYKTHTKAESVLLSNFIKGAHIDFLKMDVEGAEDLVIKDLSKKNKLRLVNEMVIEYHHHIKAGEDNLSEILKILEENSFGYQISTSEKATFKKGKFQDVLIYAYKK